MPSPDRISSSENKGTLTDAQENDIIFAMGVLGSLAWFLDKKGRARIWPGYSPEIIKSRAEQSSTTIETLSESSTEEISEGLNLAQQVLSGVAGHIKDFGRARINLRHMGVDDTVRSTDFVARLIDAVVAMDSFAPEPSAEQLLH